MKKGREINDSIPRRTANQTQTAAMTGNAVVQDGQDVSLEVRR